MWTNSQQSLLEEVVVSDVIYLSNLTIHSTQPISETNPAKRSIVATSTNYTQLLDIQSMERTEHPYLLQLIKWSQEVNHADLSFYPSLYRWNLNFQQYKELYTDVVTPLRELNALTDTLRYQQMKSVLIQAFLAEIIVHPAGLRPIADGVMNQQDYQIALRRLYPAASATSADTSEEKKVSEEKTVVIDESERSSSKRSGRKAAATAVSTVAAASKDVEMVDVSQSSMSTRRSTRQSTRQSTAQLELASSQTSRGRSRRGVETEAASVSKSQQQRSKSASPARTSSRKGQTTKSSKKKKKGKRSASVGKAVKKGDKVVKSVAKKRKHSPSPAADTTTPAAVATATAAHSAAVQSTVILAPAEVVPPPLSSVIHPSSPSVLATLVLRDLNGEAEVRVELHDPILGHVNFEKAAGSIASTCQTPVEAPRVFLGLSQLIPSSAFTPKEWEIFLQQACGAPTSTVKTKKLTASQVIHSAVQQLHDSLISTLAPRRMLSTIQFTRFSYKQVESKITSVFQLDK